MIRTLSGFLGLPSDWDLLPWPHAAWVREESDPAADVLVGYSMGGRLALRELLSVRFRAAVIVSAGLNLEDEGERRERRAADETWARRFESGEAWPELMADWDAQPVFAGHHVGRSERDYDRRRLARELRENSPGAMEPLGPRLAEIVAPVLWVAGERDGRYVEIGKAATERLAGAELWVCPGAGHRVPWEQPEAFVARLRDFLDMH